MEKKKENWENFFEKKVFPNPLWESTSTGKFPVFWLP